MHVIGSIVYFQLSAVRHPFELCAKEEFGKLTEQFTAKALELSASGIGADPKRRTGYCPFPPAPQRSNGGSARTDCPVKIDLFQARVHSRQKHDLAPGVALLKQLERVAHIV